MYAVYLCVCIQIYAYVGTMTALVISKEVTCWSHQNKIKNHEKKEKKGFIHKLIFIHVGRTKALMIPKVGTSI